MMVYRGLLLLLGVILVPHAHAATAEERVDQRTQEALAMDAHPGQGATLYAQYCSRCHGDRGSGDETKNVPALAGQRFAYLVRQLANFAGAERESTAMHGVTIQPAINDPQRWVDIAAYLNRAPRNIHRQAGSGEAVALGRGLFHEQCASCHGSDGGGDKAGLVPSLRQQHYGYLKIQMHKLATGYRHNVDEELMQFIGSFDDHDIEGIADYLSRLNGPGGVRRTMRNDGVVVN